MGSGVTRKIKQTVDCQLDLFDKVEMPVLLYGCKVQAMNVQVIERIHLKLLKQLCKLKKLYSIKYGLWRNLRVSLICQYLFQKGFILSNLPLVCPLFYLFILLSILFLFFLFLVLLLLSFSYKSCRFHRTAVYIQNPWSTQFIL